MLKKTHEKKIAAAFKRLRRLLDDQAEFERRYKNDTEFRRLIDQARENEVKKARQTQIDSQNQAHEEFENTLESSEFRNEVIQALIDNEGVSTEVATNRTNSKAKLYREALKHHII